MSDIMQKMREQLLQSENQQESKVEYTPSKRKTQEVDLRNLANGNEVRIRFIQDGDTTNPYFWRAVTFHTLTFRGIKGDDSKSSTVTKVRIPAYNHTIDKNGRVVQTGLLPVPEDMRYTNKEDPIQLYISENNLYNTAPDIYNDLNRKTVYAFQGFIVDGPDDLEPYNEPPRLLRHFNFGKDLLDIIKSHILDKECENDNPIDMGDGVDFYFRAEDNGNFKSHKSSKFSRSHTSITKEMAIDLKDNGIDQIRDRIYKVPNKEERDVIKDMLDSYLGQLPWDPEWEQYYKPVVQYDSSRSSKSSSKPKDEPVTISTPEALASFINGTPEVKQEEVKVEAPKTETSTTSSVDDLLNLIKNKSNS